MRGDIFRLLALCAVVATPAAGQNAQEPIDPEPPPPVFELIPETYIQFDWRAYPEYPVEPGTNAQRSSGLFSESAPGAPV